MSSNDVWIREATPGALYRVCRVLVRSIAKSFLDWRVLHPERVPALGPVILAANHQSFADPPLIGATLERSINFLARETLFDVPVLAPIIRYLHAYPVDRDRGGPGGLRTALGRLDVGAAVLLFPEGTRTASGQLQAARNGIGLLVIRSDAPVVPVRLFGLHDSWGRHRWLPRPHPIAIKFGHPMTFAALREEARTASKVRTKVIYEEVSRQVMESIAALEPCRDVSNFP